MGLGESMFRHIAIAVSATCLWGCSDSKPSEQPTQKLAEAPPVKGLFKCPLQTTFNGYTSDIGNTIYIDLDTRGFTKITSAMSERNISKFNLKWETVPGQGNAPATYRTDDIVDISVFDENEKQSKIGQQRFDGQNFCFAIQSVGDEPVEWYRNAASQVQYLQDATPFGKLRIPCSQNLNLQSMQYTEVNNSSMKFSGVCLPLNE